MTDEELITKLRSVDAVMTHKAADRIETLRAELKSTLEREAETYRRHDAKDEAAEAKLAKAMRMIGYAIELARFDLYPKLLDDMIDFKTEFELEKTE